jgi:alkanesulfonate monooxygenase SsuD/methylene tetrahydromethanopterin reductase-like flavin-dependent oxidoreductase (luciferase family)
MTATGSHGRRHIADQTERFSLVWTPERHFHAFGGLYPNPVVTSAAIAAVTTMYRAGSQPVAPSDLRRRGLGAGRQHFKGRVGVSFAAGWQPNDFVIAPRCLCPARPMMNNIDVVQWLWRGESVSFPGRSAARQRADLARPA